MQPLHVGTSVDPGELKAAELHDFRVDKEKKNGAIIAKAQNQARRGFQHGLYIQRAVPDFSENLLVRVFRYLLHTDNVSLKTPLVNTGRAKPPRSL
jgi:hypothetical protein